MGNSKHYLIQAERADGAGFEYYFAEGEDKAGRKADAAQRCPDFSVVKVIPIPNHILGLTVEMSETYHEHEGSLEFAWTAYTESALRKSR